MPRITKTVTLSLSPEMAEKIEEVTKEEKRTRSELFRQALRMYIEDWEWRRIYRYGETKAKQKGITEHQVEDIIDARRR